MRRYLIFCRAGDHSLHKEWLSPHEHRNFDLYLEYYGDRNGRYKEDADYYSQAKGENKLKRFAELYRKDPDSFSRYEAIWFCDDDIRTNVNDIERMFQMFSENRLWLAQPALTEDSFHSHRITIRDWKYSLRFTNFVEVMAPIFSQYALQKLMPTFEISRFTWGPDFLWFKLLGNPVGKLAIIDETPVQHTRPVGGGDLYRNNTADAWKEMFSICERYGVNVRKFDFRNLGGVRRVRIASISMVKNEADIIESFVRHHAQIMDHMFIVDNHSMDGTFEILERLRDEGLPITVKRNSYSNTAAYVQAQVMTQLLWEVAGLHRYDLIVPLDADEFLVDIEGSNPRSILEKLPLDKIYWIKWRTYFPHRDDDLNELFIPRRMQYARMDEYETMHKVIVPERLVHSKALQLTLGSHYVKATGHVDYQIFADLRLAHYPVRSVEQLKSKVMVGWITHLSRSDKRSDENWHWQWLYEELLSGKINKHEDLTIFGMKYTTTYSWSDNEKPKSRKIPIQSALDANLTTKYTRKDSADALKSLARVAEKLAVEYAQVVKVPPAVFVPNQKARYQIVSQLSGNVLDVTGGSRSDGTSVVQWSRHKDENQQWRFEDAGDGYFRIINVKSGKALCTPDESTENGKEIIQWSPMEHPSQHWMVKGAGPGCYIIMNRHSGKVLDVSAKSKKPGTQIVQWTEHGGTNQLWTMVEL